MRRRISTLPRSRAVWAVLAAVLLLAGIGGVVAREDPSPLSQEVAAKDSGSPVPPPVPVPVAPPIPIPPPPAAAVAAPPPAPKPATRPTPKKAPAPKPAPPKRPRATGPAVYRGLGTWLDVYDWSNRYTGGRPATSPQDVDRMADRGVQTLYIQASRFDSPTEVLEPDLLLAYVNRAHARGLGVVAWYLPNLVDPGRDLASLTAISRLPVESVAVDIEARDVADVDERNRRLIQLSSELRRRMPGRPLGAIVLPPVVTEVINQAYWPRFPYRQLAPSYDVWMIMGYWTNRAGGPYRDAYRYTRENVDRLRAHLGGVAVHPIGGIGDKTTMADVNAYKRALSEVGATGGSIYDWRTTKPEVWPGLASLRS